MAQASAFDDLEAQLADLRADNGLADRTIAEAVRSAGRRQDLTAPLSATGAHADFVYRLAWWAFVRAPALDVRYFLIAPMSLDLVIKQERSLDELVDELRQVEADHDLDDDEASEAAEISTDFLDEHLQTFRRHARLVERIDELGKAELEQPLGECAAAILANEQDFRTLYAQLTDHFVEEFDELARSGAFDDVMHGPHAHEGDHDADYEKLDTAEAYVERAEKRFADGDLHGAMDDCDAALSIDDDAVDAYLQRGVAQAAHDHIDQAIDDFSAALDRQPANVAALINRGLAYYGQDRFEAALDDFDQAADADPESAEVFTNRGIVRAGADDAAGAIDDFDQALELQPDSVIAHANRAMVHRSQGRVPEAIRDYQLAVELDPDYAEAWAALGFIFLSTQYYDQAIDNLSKAIELQPYAGEHYYNRATAQAGKEDYEAAIADYDKAVELDDEDVESYLNRGLARLKLQDFNGAIDDWNKAIEIDPYNPMPYAKRAGVWNLLDEPTEAASDLHRALELAPEEWEYADFAHEMLADIIEQMGYDPSKMD